MHIPLYAHLLLYNLVAGIILYASLAYNPRIWLHRMPPEVVAKVSAKSSQERRIFLAFAIPFLLWLFGYPLVYVLQQPGAWLNDFLLLGAFFAGFVIWDTLVLDVLIFCLLTPSFIIIPGTTRADYANMRYHLRSGAKGLILSLLFSALAAGLIAVGRLL